MCYLGPRKNKISNYQKEKSVVKGTYILLKKLFNFIAQMQLDFKSKPCERLILSLSSILKCQKCLLRVYGFSFVIY